MAGVRNQQAWHRRSWLFLAGLFALLIAFRILNAEELLRDSLREAFRLEHAYDQRRDLQRHLAAGVIAIAAMAALWWLLRIARSINGRRNFAVVVALAGGLGMLVLIALRLISMHSFDALLYGPTKLNWFADIGLSCLVAGAAMYYVRIVRSLRR